MIVGALSITETITWGIIYYGFAVFLTPMERDLGFSRVALTGAFSVGLLMTAAVGLSVGRWIDRHDWNRRGGGCSDRSGPIGRR